MASCPRGGLPAQNKTPPYPRAAVRMVRSEKLAAFIHYHANLVDYLNMLLPNITSLNSPATCLLYYTPLLSVAIVTDSYIINPLLIS